MNEIVGWYCTGTKPENIHVEVQKKVSDWYSKRIGGKKLVDKPIFLMMNTHAKLSDESLPVMIYNSDMTDRTYKIHSDDAETVAVVHCVKEAKLENTKGSKCISPYLTWVILNVVLVVVSHYCSVYRAVAMMRERLKALHEYVLDCKESYLHFLKLFGNMLIPQRR